LSPNITILDGAMGTELRKRGVRVASYKSSIWSAYALLEDPKAVEDLHFDYIMAGSQVITANNYAVTRKLLQREGMEDQLPELTALACRLAQHARERARKEVLIAGSLPPLDTTYRADLVGAFEDNLVAYREMAEVLKDHVDIILCETLTTGLEAKAAATAALETGKKVWVSMTLSPEGDRLRGGESIEDALDELEALDIDVYLFNCSATQAISSALPKLRGLTDKPLGAYANPVLVEPAGGEPEMRPTERLNLNEYAEIAAAWVEAGASYVGGCCDTGPEHIEKLVERFG